MTEEKRMFTSFKKNDTTNDRITFGDNSQGKVLGMVKLLLQSNILFLKFFLLNLWTIIYCLFHNFMR
jgi:putative flippase GtrA